MSLSATYHDPLHQGSEPTESGRINVCHLCVGTACYPVALHYELRGPVDGEKVVLVNGAFGTVRHYDQLADVLADNGLRVITYDFRHVGASRAGPSEPVTPNQTAELLAKDSLALLDAVWPMAACHVAGMSMGGMIAQQLALLLLRQGRLASLYISCSSGGLWMQPLIKYFSTQFFRWVLGFTVLKDRTAMAKQMVRDSFTPEYLNSVSADPKAGGKTMRELWVGAWSEHFDELFCFGDLDVAAGQAPVGPRYWLAAADAAALRASAAPKLVYVASRDAMISPKEQRALAASLGAQCVETAKSHLEGYGDALVMLPKHVKQAAAGGAAAGAETGAE